MATKTNVEINGRKYYRITRTIGHKFVDGKKIPIKKQFLGSSKGDAEQKYKAFLEAEARKKYLKEIEYDISTLGSRAKEYIENVLEVTDEYADNTSYNYKLTYYKHIKGTWLDNMRVADMKPADVQRFYKELEVSQATLNTIHNVLAAIFEWMQINDYSSNIMSGVKRARKPAKKGVESDDDDIIVWDDEELKKIKEAKLDPKWHFFFMLLIYSGMRIGEVLGLKFSDIYDGSIHVERQLSRNKLMPPKYKSKRDIPVHPNLQKALDEYLPYATSDFCFPTQRGNLYYLGSITKLVKNMYPVIGVEYKTFHTYRRTFCTNLCKAKVPLEVASKLLGHKSLEVTAKFYAKIHNESKVEAINKLK